jgi:hypothetical protein
MILREERAKAGDGVKQREHEFGTARLENRVFGALFLLVIGCGMVARLVVAIARIDLVWPDEHFQALEPAYKIVSGHGLMAWEWTAHYRTWVIPALYIPIVAVCKLLGVNGGILTIKLCRLFTALASGSVILSLNRVGRFLRLGPLSRFSSLLLFALSVPMILWSPTTLADTWAMIATWAVIPYLLFSARRQESDLGFRTGLAAMVPVLVKIQMLPWAVVALILLVSYRRSKRFALEVAGGAIVAVLGLGLFEFLTWGGFYPAILKQLRDGAEISKAFGVSPWWNYFTLYARDNGIFELIVFCALGLMVALNGEYWKRFASKANHFNRELVVLCVPFLLLFVFFCAVGHKETRFILPIFPLLFCFIGIALDLIGLDRPRPARYETILVVATACILPLLTWVATRVSLGRSLPMTDLDLSRLEEQIRMDRSQRPVPEPAHILLVRANWTFTRGCLLQGSKTFFESGDSIAGARDRILACSYVILPQSDLADLEQIRSLRGWKELGKSRGWIAFRQGNPVITTKGAS